MLMLHSVKLPIYGFHVDNESLKTTPVRMLPSPVPRESAE
jgi:hypothetical protein